MNPIKKLVKMIVGEETDLEERIFRVILNIGIIIVFISSIVTFMEDLSIFATISTASGFVLFVLIAFMYYRFHLVKTARLLLCYTLNLIVIPVTFFTCGGIDSGMPLYMLACLFVIIPLLAGKARWICFGISLASDVIIIGLSYNFMAGNKAKHNINTDFLAKLTLEDRIIDMLASIVLVAFFVGITYMLVLRAYTKEREKTKELYDRLAEMSRRDELTGLCNRRLFFQHLQENQIIGDKRFYTAMFDIDHFKRVNDVYGHLFGDTVLRDVAGCIFRNCKPYTAEMASRYGGEEFVLLLCEPDPEKVMNRLESIRFSVGELRWEEHPELVVTISGGVVSCEGYEHARDMLSQADKYLYEAKEGGRNRIVC